jgi:predicted RNase H-like nuclease (RuvC/YqgF family)
VLDEKDLQAIAGLITKSESKILTEMDKRTAKSESKILTEMDKRITKSENLMLDELDRTRSILEDEMKAVKKNMDELSQYYRITKLEGDNTTLLLKMITKLEKEVEDLKQKIA